MQVPVPRFGSVSQQDASAKTATITVHAPTPSSMASDMSTRCCGGSLGPLVHNFFCIILAILRHRLTVRRDPSGPRFGLLLRPRFSRLPPHRGDEPAQSRRVALRALGDGFDVVGERLDELGVDARPGRRRNGVLRFAHDGSPSGSSSSSFLHFLLRAGTVSVKQMSRPIERLAIRRSSTRRSSVSPKKVGASDAGRRNKAIESASRVGGAPVSDSTRAILSSKRSPSEAPKSFLI